MRIRTIKPEFWEDEDLSRVSVEAVLLAVGLLNYSDDEGYFKAHPGLVQAAVFPLRECSLSIQELLQELSNIGYIEIMEGSDGKRYGNVCKFLKHQRINRPTPSKIKGLVVSTHPISDDSVSNHGAITAGMEKEKEGKGKGSCAPARDQDQKDKDKAAEMPRHPLVALCLELWSEWPQDQIEQSVLTWSLARLNITERILRDAKASMNPREPYSRIHTWVVRQAQFAARDVEKGQPRPQPKEQAHVPDAKPQTDSERLEQARQVAEITGSGGIEAIEKRRAEKEQKLGGES